MTLRPGRARGRRLALLPGLALAGSAHAACLVLASHPDGATLARIAADRAPAGFTIAYVHSVTRTPVEERYRVDRGAIVETEIRFEQHGPGLPTEADAGGAWRREGARYVVTMERRFDAIPMRVHADQSPQLRVTGDARAVDLAQWGNRALALTALPGTCGAGS